MEEPRPHAPSDSALGRLQRGTGRGYLEALAAPARGREELLACILRDPRHDPQTECRAAYYAALARELGVGADEVLPASAEIEFASPGAETLVVEVCAELALRGDAAALGRLRAGGDVALGMLSALRTRPQWCATHVSRELMAELAARMGPDELVDDVEIHGPFWHPWRERVEDVEQAFVDAAAGAAAEAAAAPAPIGDPAALGTAALIQQLALVSSDRATDELARRAAPRDRKLLADCVTEGASMRLARIAAGVLGRAADDSLLECAAAAFAQDDDLDDPARRLSALERMRRAVYLHYVKSLPAELTRERARDWWRAGGFARTAGAAVLAVAAEPQDREWIEAHVRAVLDRTSGWTIVAELEALGAIGDARSEPLLCQAAESVGLGVARVAALRSLASCGARSDRARQVLEEALWDAEDEARELACAAAPSSPRADRRCAALARDPHEDEGVVRAAQARAR